MYSFPRSIKHPSGARFSLERDRVLITFRKGVTLKGQENILDELELKPAKESPVVISGKNKNYRINQPLDQQWAFAPDKKSLSLEFRKSAYDKYPERIQTISPVYRAGRRRRDPIFVSPLADTLYLKINPHLSATALSKLESRLERYGLIEDKNMSALLLEYRQFRTKDPSKTDVYRLKNRLEDYVEGIMEARLEFDPFQSFETGGGSVPGIPSDPHYGDQWNLVQIQAGGPSIQQVAWDITAGDSTILVAVLDNGVKLDHPDLAPNIPHPGFNVSNPSLDGSPATSSRHGTNCAGVIGAVIDNGQGMSGLAGYCSILPIAIPSKNEFTVQKAIVAAVQNKARVISMSFGVYGLAETGLTGDSFWDFSVVEEAIEYADSEGVVICASVGNDDLNSTIAFPARHPKVIAVGASGLSDNRHPDSNHGVLRYPGNLTAFRRTDVGVSVVAPGIDIPTTSFNGSGAATTRLTFARTSAACAHVSGLAALILSINPNLDPQEVRFIIEDTADKVGPATYLDDFRFPASTWNPEMGHGRINAYRACKEALKSKGGFGPFAFGQFHRRFSI